MSMHAMPTSRVQMVLVVALVVIVVTAIRTAVLDVSRTAVLLQSVERMQAALGKNVR